MCQDLFRGIGGALRVEEKGLGFALSKMGATAGLWQEVLCGAQCFSFTS